MRSIIRLIQITLVLTWYALQLHRPYGVRIRRACEVLGPIFVKIGQLLSTRADLLPDEVAYELAKLQDQVPPYCGKRAAKIVSKALGMPLAQAFKDFDLKPLASASIAQVHAATLPDGQDVVVKILRPNVKKHVVRDLKILWGLAWLLHISWPTLRRFKPCAVIREIKKCLIDELDLLREAANATQLRRNFLDSPLLYVPIIYWSHTRHNIITMERIYGVPISNRDALIANRTDLKRLAERGVEIFFTQVFRDRFFHADMHPGNVWVSPKNPADPQYLALDFGIIGTLDYMDQYYLAQNFLAFFKRDYRRIAELHVESGWVPAHTRVNEFEAAIRAVCEPIFARPLKDISFGKTLLRLFQTARRFDMTIQPQLILLQKTLISVEGLGRQLYPDLDLWNTALPFLEDWARKRVNTGFFMHQLKSLGPYWLEKLPDLPRLVYKTLQNVPAISAQPAVIRLPIWYYFLLGALTATLIILTIGTLYG